MKPGDPASPQHEEAAQDRKENKGEVEAQDNVSQYPRPHSFPPGGLCYEDTPSWPCVFLGLFLFEELLVVGGGEEIAFVRDAELDDPAFAEGVFVDLLGAVV